jgi:iron(III) transport system ATP-binding protein
LLKSSGTTAVFVTHDQEEALFIGDRVAVMNQGRLEQVDSPYDLYHRPQSRFVAEFMGHTDFIQGVASRAGVETALGVLPGQCAATAGTAVAVCVRPDDIALTADPEGNARVVERRFIGMAYIYTIALADGGRLRSWQFHTEDFAPGTAVQASIRPGHHLNYFVGERAVGR